MIPVEPGPQADQNRPAPLPVSLKSQGFHLSAKMSHGSIHVLAAKRLQVYALIGEEILEGDRTLLNIEPRGFHARRAQWPDQRLTIAQARMNRHTRGGGEVRRIHIIAVPFNSQSRPAIVGTLRV